MTKSIYFSVFSLFLLLAFAFTPVDKNTANEEAVIENVVTEELVIDEAVAGCCGYFKVESFCLSPFPVGGAILTVLDPSLTPILSVAANGYYPIMLTTPGFYTVQITSPTAFPCNGTVGWEFCGGISNGGTPFFTPYSSGFNVIFMNC